MDVDDSDGCQKMEGLKKIMTPWDSGSGMQALQEEMDEEVDCSYMILGGEGSGCQEMASGCEGKVHCIDKEVAQKSITPQLRKTNTLPSLLHGGLGGTHSHSLPD